MKRFMSGCISVTLVAALFAYADADLGFRTGPEIIDPSAPQAPLTREKPLPHFPPVPPSNIYSTSKGIHLRFQDFPLGEVLQNIQHETGIQFNLSPQMAAWPVNVNITADNWKKAVRKLIADYSRVEIWTDRPQTTRVWLLESTPFSQPSVNVVQASARGPRSVLQPVRTSFRRDSAPAPTPARTSMNGPSIPLESLPQHILLEPGVLRYLQSKGVKLPRKIQAMYGPKLEGLPRNVPISTHVLNDPVFLSYLESAGIERPQG